MDAREQLLWDEIAESNLSTDEKVKHVAQKKRELNSEHKELMIQIRSLNFERLAIFRDSSYNKLVSDLAQAFIEINELEKEENDLKKVIEENQIKN